MPTPRQSRRNPLHSPTAACFAPRWVGCVWFPQLPLDLELQRHPELRDRPVVLVGRLAEKGIERVLGVSAVAAATGTGIAVGTPAHAVASCCPGAAALPYDTPYYGKAFEALLLRLEAVTPLREPDGFEAIYLDLAGLPHLDPEDPWQVQEALQPHLPPGTDWRLGIATGRFTSWCAAHMAKPGVPLFVPEAEKAAFLDGLPTFLLPTDARTLDQLHLLGLRTLGHLARLPRQAVLAQLGWPGERLHRLASGEDHEPLQPYAPKPVIRETFQFSEPVETVAEFEAMLGALLRQLWDRPDRERGGVRQLLLHARLEEGGTWSHTVTLRRAHEQWVGAFAELRRRLEGVRPAGGLLELSVEVTSVARVLDCQPALIETETEYREALLGHAIEHLRARLHRTAVYRLAHIRPRSPLPEQRWKLIAYDPFMSRARSRSR